MNFGYWILTTHLFSAGAGYTFSLFKQLWPSINEATLIFEADPGLRKPKFQFSIPQGPYNLDVFGNLIVEQGVYIELPDFPDFRFAYLPNANRIYYYGRVDQRA